MQKIQNQSEYISQEIIDRVAVLWLDQKGEKINKVSGKMADIFAPFLEEVEQNPQLDAVVLISRKKDFIAGADIDEFLQMGPGDAARVSARGHDLLNRIEGSSKPFVAALHGATMGAGLEIALACSARIAVNAPNTALALPEVKLGILPGGGGTQRLPRLIGIQRALNMILTGQTIYAKKALRYGLVDKLVSKENLLEEAVGLAKSLVSKPSKRKNRLPLLSRIIEFLPFTRDLIYQKAGEMVLKQTKGNYPAPPKIIECIRTGMEEGFEAGSKKEIREFDILVQTPVSRQLIHLFFAVTHKKKNPLKEFAKEVSHIGIIGSGKMGSGIAQLSLEKGMGVSLIDKSHKPIEIAFSTLKKAIARKVRKGALTRKKAKEILHQLAVSTEYDILSFCGLVIETIEEKIEPKRQVLANMESVAEEGCIFASNTSTLSIGEIAAASKRPGQVIGIHYFPPAERVPFVEIVSTAQTKDWVKATAIDVAIRQNKSFILVTDSPGFLVSRVLAAYLNEAVLMIEEGVNLLLLENTMKEYGFASGPLTTLDEVGLDYGAKVTRSGLMDLFKSRGVVASRLLPSMAEAGIYGRRNKKGFFKYNKRTGKRIPGGINPQVYTFIEKSSRISFPKDEITDRLVMTIVNEASVCLQEGIIQSPSDGDIGAVLGLGFPPFLGGPFRLLDSMGSQEAMGIFAELENSHGVRFKPADILIENHKSGKSFY